MGASINGMPRLTSLVSHDLLVTIQLSLDGIVARVEPVSHLWACCRDKDGERGQYLAWFWQELVFDHEMCSRWGAGENEEVAISLGHRICCLPFDWSDEMGATRTGVRKMVHALGAKLVPLTAFPLEEPLELLVVGFDDGLGMNTGPSVT